ncbi:hypothetical protein DAPPUDRAFT_301001 [Daphnia pulex]|jgi:hypothetical protein|uniref:Uncharacterized protein n=1 Tax=Daphnia pulex TaxID=6669 RepID=E9HG51_DAPPU|nr:hypothetical protein DAPPUDRAFT_301001 [Daphnia pulex]|eukprot:EFX69248.1 hypothetical protein DAPPUDRAFT_301001 [Daphnia pulex]
MGTCWLYFVVVVRGRAAVAKRKETGNQKYINFGRKNFKMCTETFFLFFSVVFFLVVENHKFYSNCK